MNHHTQFLNFIANSKDCRSYLEIGVFDPSHNFDLIEVRSKIGVDPDPNAKAIKCMTSNEFFSKLDKEIGFDLIWIDGLHQAEQVCQDIENSIRHLNPGGIIGLHDMLPPSEITTCWPRGRQREWCGTTYLAGAALHGLEDFDRITVNADYGCMFIRWKGKKIPNLQPSDISWEEFEQDWFRNKIMNVVTVEEFKEWVNKP